MEKKGGALQESRFVERSTLGVGFEIRGFLMSLATQASGQSASPAATPEMPAVPFALQNGLPGLLPNG
jgi:hypothetical protein